MIIWVFFVPVKQNSINKLFLSSNKNEIKIGFNITLMHAGTLESNIIFWAFISSLLIEFIEVTKSYRLQIHNFITHHLCTALCVYHFMSSFLPSPFIPSISSPTSLHPLCLWQSSVVCVHEFFYLFFLLCSIPLPCPLSSSPLHSCQPTLS